MRNLKELTQQESGIVIILYNGQGALYDWGSAYKSPRTLPPNLIGCEEVPEIEGERMDISNLLKNICLQNICSICLENICTFGTVYRVGDITVIAPDGWA